MRIKRVAAALMAWLVLSTPSIAAACAVCSAGKDEENALAFLLSTIFMSLMPLVAIGTLVFVLWKRIQKLEAETSAREEATRAQSGSRGALAPETGPVLPRTS